jgi:hypothetical protein
MSVMRLLALGQSLIGIKGQGAQYQISEQNRLPKFNVGNRASVSAPSLAGKRGLFDRSEGVAYGWKGYLFRRSQTPKADQPLVQATLSLERVQVVRNDLTESDLVIVPVKALPAPRDRTKTDKLSRSKGVRTAATRLAQRVTDAARALV